jgi:hypothetical protein
MQSRCDKATLIDTHVKPNEKSSPDQLYDTDQSVAKGMSDITLGEEIETRRKKLKES